MSDYCNCCADNVAWVINHAVFDLAGEDCSEFHDTDWLGCALAAVDLWHGMGDALDISVGQLADLLRAAYRDQEVTT